MKSYTSYLSKIHSQKEENLALLESWVNINSWTDNLPGLQKMTSALKDAFRSLGGHAKQLPLPVYKKINQDGHLIEFPLGDALHLMKHPHAPIKVLLAGHMDTVFPPSSPFQKGKRLDGVRYNGPGAADMKGGLLVMLKSLEALESSPYAGKIGWEVLITPDEEIGSPGSEHLYKEAAHRNQIGLIFEPAFPDGSIVNQRKGSFNFTVVAHGKAAHAGRDSSAGKNAIVAIARFVMGVETLRSHYRGITVNVGYIKGGEMVNIVPDTAICKINIRIVHPEDEPRIRTSMREMVNGCASPDGISLDLYENSYRPPKIFDEKSQALFSRLAECGESLGMNLKWETSGGVSDGNLLAAAGLPNIDTLGVVGGNLHTSDEYMLIDSLNERTILTACFLMKLANEEIKL